MTIGEDFAFYSHCLPALFIFLGAGENRNLHTSTFSIAEESFKYGPLLLSATALEYLGNNQ